MFETENDIFSLKFQIIQTTVNGLCIKCNQKAKTFLIENQAVTCRKYISCQIKQTTKNWIITFHAALARVR